MERRRYRRIAATLRKDERVLIKLGSEYIPASLVDLSAGGALLALPNSEVEIPFGDYCLLFLDHGSPLFSVRALALRWQKEGRIGFKFSSLTSADQRQIHTKLIRMGIVSARVQTQTAEKSAR